MISIGTALRSTIAIGCLAAVSIAAAGCGSDNSGSRAAGSPHSIKVVATTTQLGDIVRDVGGADVRVTQILHPNTDPHEYEPRPRDVEDTAGADVVFTSGDNLDKWMANIVKQSGGNPPVVDLSTGLPEHLPGEKTGPEASTYDPHWWHDPRNVEAAVTEIRNALSKAEPGARATFDTRATAYLAKLRALDAGIQRCFATVPVTQRKLVTDHDAFGYFAKHYDITVVGAVIPSQTTQAQPSARAVSKLVQLIRAEHVKAVFPETSVNQKLAKAIARATGATANLTLYGDTLGPSGSAGATYLSMELANADAMIKGFTGRPTGCQINGI